MPVGASGNQGIKIETCIKAKIDPPLPLMEMTMKGREKDDKEL